MKEIMDLLFRFKSENPNPSIIAIDPTIYRIDTNTHSYIGQILFQNDILIKVKTEGPRVVKILKQNIQRVVIEKTEKIKT